MNVQMPGYRINEYRLVIPIAAALQQSISKISNALHEKYKVKPVYEPSTSLTIAKCFAFGQNEPRLLEGLQAVAMHQRPFKIEMKGFSAYPSHSIYINVETKSPFVEMVKALKRIKWLMNIPDYEPHFFTEPNVLIAQKLKPMQFINMWMECEHSMFTGRFVANELLLLKRNSESEHFEISQKWEFMSLPTEVKQGVLFG